MVFAGKRGNNNGPHMPGTTVLTANGGKTPMSRRLVWISLGALLVFFLIVLGIPW